MAAALAGAWTASASLIVSENFDAKGQAALTSPGAGNSTAIGTVLPGWSVTANNANQANVVIGNATVGGYGVGAYLATGDGTDFSLSSYQTGAGAVTFITYTIQNTGATALSGLNGSFDYESGWTRNSFSTLRTAGFEVGMTYQVNAGAVIATSPANTWHASNSNVTLASDVNTWLTDGRMDALGLSSRNLAFALTGVTLNPGDSVTLKWAQSVYVGDKNMAQGIDNFKFGDNNDLAAVPEPTTMIAGALLLLPFGASTLRMLRKNRKA